MTTIYHHPGDHPLVSDGSADLSILVFFSYKRRKGGGVTGEPIWDEDLEMPQFLPACLICKRPHARMSNVIPAEIPDYYRTPSHIAPPALPSSIG